MDRECERLAGPHTQGTLHLRMHLAEQKRKNKHEGRSSASWDLHGWSVLGEPDRLGLLGGSKSFKRKNVLAKSRFFTCSRRSIFDTYDLLWPVDRPPWTLKDLTKHLDTLQHACRAYWKGLGLFGGARGPYSVRTCGHEQNLILLLFLPGHPMSS